MKCMVCKKEPHEIEEYRDISKIEKTTPEKFIIENEGTYNKDLDIFCCTDCYFEIGMPLGKAPFGVEYDDEA